MNFRFIALLLAGPVIISCNSNSKTETELTAGIDLKKGPVISCGPADKEFGTLDFSVSCSSVKDEFNFAVKLLHSFEYDEAEKAFSLVLDKEPRCAMAYWGVAMSNFHSLWAPPTVQELEKGSKALDIARSLSTVQREKDYIEAIGSFYDDWKNKDHKTRCLAYETAMQQLKEKYPGDKEATIFYALALITAADPADKTFTKQKKAGEVLESLYPGQPGHPGIVHYLIHTYDSPELANFGLEAARKYASIAPSSAHALHMPSHIFTRLGLWDECISSNLASVSSARCYAEAIGLEGHWDEEMHGLDYLVYAHLQNGNNDSARKYLDYLNTITRVDPVNFKVAYAYAAIPSRIALENRMWQQAANLEAGPAGFAWEKFPWQRAIVHFTRLIGNVHLNKITEAKKELGNMRMLHDSLLKKKESYMANQVDIQIKTGEAWILMGEGKKDEALARMHLAARMEDETGKHPVTPGEVLPARELLGDMLMEMNQPALALEAYEQDLEKHVNRFNGLWGAANAAQKSGNTEKANKYFALVADRSGRSDRNEVAMARKQLGR
jgi:tetratricopeptide (TPR) repeat protein